MGGSGEGGGGGEVGGGGGGGVGGVGGEGEMSAPSDEGKYTFSSFSNKKINWKPSIERNQQNEML